MNRLFLLLFGVVSLVAHAQVPDYVPTEGLVAWYPFNGNANDESGNGYDCESVGATLTEDRFEAASSAFAFDGQGSHLQGSSLPFSDLSISLWFKAAAGVFQTYTGGTPPTGAQLIGQGTTHNPCRYCDWAIGISDWQNGVLGDDNLTWEKANSSSCQVQQTATNWEPELEEWTHLAAISEGVDVSFYINGNWVSTVPFDQPFQQGGSILSIGSRYVENCNGGGSCTGPDNAWSGSIDDVAVWNRALTEAEILALYNAELPTPGCTDPTACNFDAEATEDDGSCLLTFCNDTLYVPQDYPNVQQAVNASDDGDVIILAEGTHISGQTIEVENKSITVQGCCSAEDVILSGENSHRVLNVSGNIEDHTVFKNLTIAFGRPGPDDHASALKVNGCQATFFQVIIEQNGGGTGNTVAYGSGSGLTLFDRCIVRNNSVENYAGLRAAKVRKSILHNNVGWNNTGVLLDCESYNCTVYGNGGGAGNPWTSSGLSGGLARNCIFWNNSAQAAYNPESVEYSLNSGHTGEGNIDGDPMFLDANSGIFSLLPGSPAVDSGDPNPDYNDFDGSRNDMGAIALSENFYGPAGCTDPNACNFDAEATSDDGGCIPAGCMEPEACNYNALAECEGEACDYSCCPGPGCCGEGMYWNYEVSQCAILETCQDDLDGDGVIGVNDLMQLLSSFGTDCAPAEEPETTEFTCGDPVNYHGYDYATVQIGEQCWFAENLRNEHYANGDAIPGELSNSEWSSTTEGAQAVYGNDVTNLEAYGRLYNGHSANDARGLCPSGWHVPINEEHNTLVNYLGGDSISGMKLKSSPEDIPSWDGSNVSGFAALAGGFRHHTGVMDHLGWHGGYWSSTSEGPSALCIVLNDAYSGSGQIFYPYVYGQSVRCIKD